MDLDKTAIALRQRSFTDSIDLSLTVVRTYWRSLLTWASLGAVPFALVNAFCLYRMTDFTSMLIYEYDILDPNALRIRYLFWMTALVFLETPIALIGVTYFLGQSVFFGSPTVADFRVAVRQTIWGIIWILGVLRLGILGCIAPFCTSTENQVNLTGEWFFFGFVAIGTTLCVRSVRPFAPEILILERSPLRVKKGSTPEKGIAFKKRSKWLHQPVSGELFRRSVASSIVSLFLLASFSMGWLFLGSIFFNSPSWDWWMDYFLFPFSLWLVAIWSTVVRFLSYLDTRTRLEGWELELRLRAEGNRIQEAIE